MENYETKVKTWVIWKIQLHHIVLQAENRDNEGV